MLNRAAGRPGPELPGDTSQQGSLVGFQGEGSSLNANTIQRHIHDVQSDLNEPDWAAAEENMDDLWNTWLAFRPRMQAQAGTEMWNTEDVSTFEATIRQLADQIEKRNANAALEQADILNNIAKKYIQVQPRVRQGPVNPEGLAN